MSRNTGTLVSLLMLTATSVAATESEEKSIRVGFMVATERCAACHIASLHQTLTPLFPDAPKFEDIAKLYSEDATSAGLRQHETKSFQVLETEPIPTRKTFQPPPPVASTVPQADRESALRMIREEIGDCTRCALHKGRNKLVYGDGSPNARLMFVGEGPGADEDAQGLPFVGRAGQLLNNMIAAMGLKREEVYIANVVKCRPPGTAHRSRTRRIPARHSSSARSMLSGRKCSLRSARPQPPICWGSGSRLPACAGAFTPSAGRS